VELWRIFARIILSAIVVLAVQHEFFPTTQEFSGVLKQTEQAKTDIIQAICFAQSNCKKDQKNWKNVFNLALYHLAAGEDDRAKFFYRDALRRGASAPSIREAIQDLKDFLAIFPNHGLAHKAQQFLQNALQKIK
jgi:tetratricopeptide (TPR) repeat protein